MKMIKFQDQGGETTNKRAKVAAAIFISVFFIATSAYGQFCRPVERLFMEEKQLMRSKLADSLLKLIAPNQDSVAQNGYENCLVKNISLLNNKNILTITSFYGQIDFLFRHFGHRYNIKILNSIWHFAADTSMVVRQCVRSFFKSRTDYIQELFASSLDIKKQLRTLLINYPYEYCYIGEIKKYRFYDLLPLLKDKLILGNKAQTQFTREQKWGALIICYSLGDNSVFPLIEDFIDKEQNGIQKYALCSYVLGIFGSDNERKLLLKILIRKDILTDMPNAERVDFPLNNYFTEFIVQHISKLYPGYGVDRICKSQNPFNDVRETEGYSRFHCKCLYDETIKWFKSEKLLK